MNFPSLERHQAISGTCAATYKLTETPFRLTLERTCYYRTFANSELDNNAPVKAASRAHSSSANFPARKSDGQHWLDVWPQRIRRSDPLTDASVSSDQGLSTEVELRNSSFRSWASVSKASDFWKKRWDQRISEMISKRKPGFSTHSQA